MSQKSNKELLDLDIYEILGVTIEASEKEIKKCFRKKALACHPDKNPDNPNAAQEFNKLKRILEILLDAGARKAYDKVLRGRKAAALRAKQANLKSKSFKDKLEKREKAAQESAPQLSESEKLRREIKRLEEEGEQLIQEELESLNREARADIKKAFSAGDDSAPQPPDDESRRRIKARWKSTEDWPGYTEEEINRLFYKWGEISAVVIKTKGNRNTALIEFKDGNGAEMAVQFEKGLPGKPIEVSSAKQAGETQQMRNGHRNMSQEGGENSKDFETIAAMNRRREAERQRLIQQMMASDS